MELGALAFQAVGRDAACARARRDAFARDGDAHIDEKRHLRFESPGRERRERAQRVVIHTAAVALIGEGRAREAVAQHEAPGGERGRDHLAHVLGARCVDDERLRDRIDCRFGIHEGGPQAIAERGAARFSRCEHVEAARAQERGEAREERRFSAPLDAFDDDEARLRRGYADAPVPYGRSLLRKNSTRRFGSMPVLRDITRCCSASWCCMRRTYDVCGVSSIGLLSSSTL